MRINIKKKFCEQNVVEMSLLSIVRVLPVAIRIAVAGGGVYGTVKVGVWNDSERSREKLSGSWKDAIQIHPSTVPETKVRMWYCCTVGKAHYCLSQYKDEVSAVTHVTTSWNSAVRNACGYFIGTDENPSQAADFTANKFAQLRKWAGSK